MGMHTITKVSALFVVGSQSTGITVQELPGGTYDVKTLYRCSASHAFPSRDVTEREGMVFDTDIDGLVRRILAVVCHGWYHHYLREGAPVYDDSSDSWWNLRIEYGDGQVCRWEGINDAPDTIDSMYKLLVDFGMPALRLGYRSFGGVCRRRFSDNPFRSIMCYESLLTGARALETEPDHGEPLRLLVRELVDDIDLCLRKNETNLADEGLLEVWGIDPGIEGLLAADVMSAPRAKMLALFHGLTHTDDVCGSVMRALDCGAFGLWCKRLRQIPHDELLEKEHRRRKEHDELIHRVDEALDRRVGLGAVFTSYEVAEETGATAQEVSVRIRRLVNADKVKTVGKDTPRRYTAA